MTTAKSQSQHPLIRQVAAQIPMLAYLQPEIAHIDSKSCTVILPLNEKSKNHLNCMYFGALAAGADCAGGLMALAAIQKTNQKVDLIFKDFKADFLKRAEGDVHFTCSQGEAIINLVAKAVASGERVFLPLHVQATVPSLSPDPAAVFTLTLSLKKR
ncbi:MAG: DUF4442 domain-containing protein [Acidobacteria bacterium]|nr:MAG: DUF4442 domain-containing protein [Acidobacteriota bacterium]